VLWRMVQGLPYQEVQKQWIVQWGNVSIKVWSLHFCKGIADECSRCHLDFFVFVFCFGNIHIKAR